MQRNYKLNQRLLASVLLVSLFLQSCNSTNQQPGENDKKYRKRLVVLMNQKNNIEARCKLGELVYNDWKKNNKQESINEAIILLSEAKIRGYKRANNLLEEIEKEHPELASEINTKLVEIRQVIQRERELERKELSKNRENENFQKRSIGIVQGAKQQSRIELNRSRGGQLKHTTIHQGAISGGMMRGDRQEIGGIRYAGSAGRGLTLIAESHSTIKGMEYCYNKIDAFVTNSSQQQLNFFIEKDIQRLNNALIEVDFLSQDQHNIFNIDYDQAIIRFKEYIKVLTTTTTPTFHKLYNEVYTNIIGKTDEDGLIKNRLWFLKIIHDFINNDKVKFIPIDGSFKEVIKHLEFDAVLKSSTRVFHKYEAYKESIKFKNYISSQSCIDYIMSRSEVLPIRDRIMINNLNNHIGSNTRNIALVGVAHVPNIKAGMEQKGVRVAYLDLS